MEPNQDDPGQPSGVLPHTAPLGTKEIQATLILEKFARVFCAILRSDPRLTYAAELQVPVTGAVPVQPTKRRWRLRRIDTPKVVDASAKRCWKIGDLFDANAHSPQTLLVASDGTPYCSYAKQPGATTYVEVTREFLLKQSGNTLIFFLATLEEKLEEYPPERTMSA